MPLLWETVYGRDKMHATPYLTRIWLTPKTRWGQLSLHIFHRGDEDPDYHDHPFAFWTIPLSCSYYEEVLSADGLIAMFRVKWLRRHHRKASYTHRVICPTIGTFPLVTVIWRSSQRRRWGFYVPWHYQSIKKMVEKYGVQKQDFEARGFRYWIHWRAYIFGEINEHSHKRIKAA